MKYNMVIFQDIDDAVIIKKILGNSVLLIGNCISCYNNQETFDIILGYCESNKYEITLGIETKVPKAKTGDIVRRWGEVDENEVVLIDYIEDETVSALGYFCYELDNGDYIPEYDVITINGIPFTN